MGGDLCVFSTLDRNEILPPRIKIELTKDRRINQTSKQINFFYRVKLLDISRTTSSAVNLFR